PDPDLGPRQDDGGDRGHAPRLPLPGVPGDRLRIDGAAAGTAGAHGAGAARRYRPVRCLLRRALAAPPVAGQPAGGTGVAEWSAGTGRGMKVTWKPDGGHGTLSSKERRDLPDSAYAFPDKRKEPLTDARHVQNALARFDQVHDVSDAERELAFANI